MVGVIEPNGDEITDPADAWAEPGIAAHRRQIVGLELAHASEAFGGERLAGQVWNHLRQITDAALGIEDSGFFAPGGAEADELHWRLPSLRENGLCRETAYTGFYSMRRRWRWANLCGMRPANPSPRP